ncbi:MAG: hypothetical protein ABID54_06795 [Pseudomonadota bacterium]
MRNKTSSFIVTVAIITMVSFFPLQKGFSGNDNIFLPEIERSVDQSIDAWIKEDTKSLNAAMERLTLNEAYLLAVGKTSKDRSYLVNIPTSLSRNFNAVVAYLFLIRKEREGVNLWPVSFFEGKRFQFDEEGKRQ